MGSPSARCSSMSWTATETPPKRAHYYKDHSTLNMRVLSENKTTKRTFLLTCFIVFVSQFHGPLLAFLHTHFSVQNNWHFVTHVYVMHLVELLCPKSLILDLFVVQNTNVYWFLVGDVGGKYQKYLWIVSQCLKIACKTIMSSNASMTFVPVHHRYCSEPKFTFF